MRSDPPNPVRRQKKELPFCRDRPPRTAGGSGRIPESVCAEPGGNNARDCWLGLHRKRPGLGICFPWQNTFCDCESRVHLYGTQVHPKTDSTWSLHARRKERSLGTTLRAGFHGARARKHAQTDNRNQRTAHGKRNTSSKSPSSRRVQRTLENFPATARNSLGFGRGSSRVKKPDSLRLIAADDAMVAARFMQSIFQSRGGETENYSAVKLSMLLL